MFPALLGMAASSLIPSTVMPAFMASALGTGIGTLLQGGSGQDALQSAALGGLGGYLGGQMGGGSGAFGGNPAAPVINEGIGSSLPSGMNYADLVAQTGGPATAGTMSGDLFMQGLTRPEAIGTGLGGLAASSMQMPEYKKPEDDTVYPRGMPIKNTSLFPEMGYDAGKEGEFDYRIAKNFAEGGEIEGDMAAMDMGIGGMQEGGMNDKELISGAIDVIQGEINDPDQQKVILAQFISQFGQEALQDLVARVQSGDVPSGQQEGDGKIEGAGDGMADMVPASMEGDQDVLLSDGEFVVPADVVSGIGNGSSDAGSNKLEDMMDRVRELRTGGTTQPPAIPDEMMLPA